MLLFQGVPDWPAAPDVAPVLLDAAGDVLRDDLG